jgi:hypothetical protein
VLAAVPASPALAATWSVVPTPNATSDRNQFTAVDGLSPTAAWAVGYAETGATPYTRPLVARWNGNTWSLTATPPLQNAATLNGVDGSGTTNVWAVGSAGSSTLTERWDGTAWSVVPSATPPGATDATLRAVKTLAANDAWAVGDAAVPSGTFQRRTLITHWNGTTWTIVPSPSPDPTQNLLVAVDGTSPNDLWAVGNLGHDGYGGDTVAGMMLHWNGSTWTRASIPGSDALFSIINLHDLVAVATDNVWVVGGAFHRQLFRWVPYVLHWNGTQWQHGTIPNAPTGDFRGVTALSATQVYAVGRTGGSGTLVARWNGTTWSQESTPPAGDFNVLLDATASSTGTVIAVGSQYNSSYIGRTLALHTSNG